MKIRNIFMATAAMAGMAGSVWAQDNATPARAPRAPQAKLRHLLYIAVPGDNGADDQSGVIVLDADHNYQFVKRIPYGLPASMMPGPKISGMTSSVPENKIYVTTDGGSMIAFDLGTDKIAWTFKGDGKPVVLSASRARPRMAAANAPGPCPAATSSWSLPAITSGGGSSTRTPARSRDASTRPKRRARTTSH